ncbi:uncharacterized protein LOC129592508 [Paramacrobiotus metropolitanus]|uniref:uncharacterized protein LOC129592508 n=1 Tax=Paramacrobiotus metropolitanus TaxID=2943436 RepID=UPI002445A65D|nr:uncharacterized protein LOC129592508 [Paramacrobiotus metropolitanus]
MSSLNGPSLSVNSTKHLASMQTSLANHGCVRKITRIWITLLQMCGYFPVMFKTRSIWFQCIRFAMYVYVATIVGVQILFMYGDWKHYSALKQSSNWFTAVMMQLIDVSEIFCNLVFIIFMWSSSQQILQLISDLDHIYGSLITRKDTILCATGMLVYIVTALFKNAYTVYMKETVFVTRTNIGELNGVFFSIPLSDTVNEWIVRISVVMLGMTYFGRDLLLGFLVYVILITSKIVRQVSFNLRTQLAKSGSVTIENYRQQSRLTGIVGDLDNHLSLIAGIRFYTSIAGIIGRTFDASWRPAGLSPNPEHVVAMVAYGFYLSLLGAACVYSTEQGAQMFSVARKCCHIGKTAWKRNEWMAVFTNDATDELRCFSLAGVTVTRDSAFQTAATLVSALLVFAELASGNRTDCGKTTLHNTTQVHW